jgi:hypothetical protein
LKPHLSYRTTEEKRYIAGSTPKYRRSWRITIRRGEGGGVDAGRALPKYRRSWRITIRRGEGGGVDAGRALPKYRRSWRITIRRGEGGGVDTGWAFMVARVLVKLESSFWPIFQA